MAVVLIGVIGRVIDTALLAFAAEPQIERGQAQVLQEAGIIRPGPQGVDGDILVGIQRDLAQRLGALVGARFRRCDRQARPLALLDRDAGLRVGDIGGDRIDEVLQAVAAANAQKAPPIAVGVDIGHALGLQLSGVGLGPFGGAQQHRLLGVPAGVDDRPLGLPAGLDQRPQRLGLAHHRHVAGQGIAGPKHPAVTVVAAHHPFVRLGAALQLGDHVIGRLQAPVGNHLQMDPPALAVADVIGDRQRAAPGRRRHRPTQRAEQHRRIGIGDRQGRDLQDGRRILPRQVLGVLGRTIAGRGGIAREGGHVSHRAALDPLRRPRRALGIDVVDGIAVIARIGIDDRTDRAVLLGQLGLQAAPAGAVAGDHHLAFDRDAHPLQGVIVRRHAIVHIDQRRGDIAVALEGHIGRQFVLGAT